ncbi:HPr family phosphocarrier protein [Stappia sp. F7233]|uniref:Phosphocarrier protein HPr n=1 Tax=Stappia albiluteola TaxID=2758565 RepID=A0A839ACB9_9HYPH|nr:HPr family phosphocarrier protein [Stappia albiluteola]MBA5776678.1 HPr family phosphocarrier protein [Stappia albiluteola]
MSVPAQSTKVLMIHEAGLHARPSVKFTKLAKRFGAAIEISAQEEGPWIDAKSIVKVMATRIPKGTMLHIRATGEDAGEAIAALSALVEQDFEDETVEGGA